MSRFAMLLLLAAAMAAMAPNVSCGSGENKAKHCEIDSECTDQGKANSCYKGLCRQVWRRRQFASG